MYLESNTNYDILSSFVSICIPTELSILKLFILVLHKMGCRISFIWKTNYDKYGT